MKLGVFAIYDSKAAAFLRPFFSPTTATAQRSFGDHVMDPSTPAGQHPGDFTLFELGEWDEFEGTISMLESKINLGEGTQYLAMAELEKAEERRRELREVKSNG